MINLGISLGEALAATTIAYVIAVASFNAGYFDNVPSRFVELFAFSDLVNANVPILQYIISIYSTYCAFSFVFAVPKHFLSRAADKVFSFKPLSDWSLDAISLIGIAFMSAGAIITTIYCNSINNKVFTIEFLPWAILFWFLFDVAWSNYRLDKISQKSFLIQVAVNAIFFCHISGRMWLKYETRNSDGVQAIYLQSGECLNRKLLRSTSNGLLLYSFDLKQFEFRDRGSIRTIYGTSGCT
jgi:hypothetical protein